MPESIALSEREPVSPRRSLLDAYAPMNGIPDEMMGPDGAVRPLWAGFVAELERLGPQDLSTRFARADQYLRDAGVHFRVYEGSGENERAWPLAHVPMLIGQHEWSAIASGLTQRADLLEAVVADIYGPNHLVERGLLPPDLIAASAEYLRPMVGATPAGGRFLHFCAFELGRGPDGRWWVLGDRTQAPSGAGFALENRVAATRALAESFGGMQVHRLASFFRQFRDALTALADENKGQAAILTPGPLNDTYYEQAYIARYLGMMLLEGEDLTVVDGRPMVRTVSGLRPVGLLWRRLDAAFADPLELNPGSRIGTPGLAQALRQGRASMVNALGSGIVETRALLAFLPRIAKQFLGAPLALPNVATWWCGQAEAGRHVADHFDRMMVGPALSTRLPFEDDDQTRLGAVLDRTSRASLLAELAAEGRDWVGQEAISLSTTPVFSQGRLEPRPVILRVYLARTAQGWTAMPGGMARVGSTPDPRAIAMQRGGRAADVWIVSDRPVERDTLLAAADAVPVRIAAGSLPSRAAENLLWLGRYIERSEDAVRMLRACHARLAETSDPALPLLIEMRKHLKPLDLGIDSAIPKGLLSSIERSVGSAGRVRDRFAPDGWLALRDLAKTAHRFADDVTPGADAMRAMTVLLRKLAGFSGLLSENMYRSSGWRFLEIGRRIERGIHMSGLLRRLTRPGAPDGALDMMLEIGDSVLTHRRLYQGHSGRRTVTEILALDPLNPRSILFQLDRLREEVGRLPGNDKGYPLTVVAKEVLKLHTGLAIREPGDINSAVLQTMASDFGRLYDALAGQYLR